MPDPVAASYAVENIYAEATREKHDQYFTEPLLAEAIVKRVTSAWNAFGTRKTTPARILECAVGKGGFSDAVRKQWPNAEIVGVDIDPEMEVHAKRSCDKFVCADFLGVTTTRPFDLVITNPPFSHALEFYHKSLELTVEGGAVSFLLRMAFNEANKRYKEVWAKSVRHFCYQAAIVPRPIFINGTSDRAQAYANFVWFKDSVGKLASVYPTDTPCALCGQPKYVNGHLGGHDNAKCAFGFTPPSIKRGQTQHNITGEPIVWREI